MTFWIVLGCVFLFFLVLLLSPVTFVLDYRESFFAQVRYLFLRYTLFPRPEKPEKPAKEAEKEPVKEKPSRFRELLKEQGISGVLALIKEGAKIAQSSAKRLLRHMTVKEFSILLSVGGADAGQAALNYGGACAAVYPAVALILGTVKHKDYEIGIAPNFQSSESSAECRVRAKIKLLFAILLALHAGVQILKIGVKLRKDHSKNTTQKEKAVLPHGGSSN